MTLFPMILLVFGLSGLIIGAELLVKKSEILAKHWQVHPFVIGVVLLGMGTSAPEWAVSAFSSFKELSDLAVGNVFGSNICNILLILGLILLSPLSKSHIVPIKKDILFLILSSFVLIPMMWDQNLSRLDALGLSVLFCAYMVLLFISQVLQKKRPIEFKLKPSKRGYSFAWLKTFLIIILGFALLVGGSHYTIEGALGLGQRWGISERLLGLFIVSIGTSLPELFTALTAVLKGHKDMAIGNIIGSNIFNTFAILSTSAWINPATLDAQVLSWDLPFLLITHISLSALFFVYRKRFLQSLLALVFFGGYIAYLILLVA